MPVALGTSKVTGRTSNAALEGAEMRAKVLVFVLLVTLATEIGHCVGSVAQDAVGEDIVSRLISDLADDDVRRNAARAMDELQHMGLVAVTYLEKALNSRDRQQRQLAACTLRRMTGYDPSLEMLRVTVEGLQDDMLPEERRGGVRYRYTYAFNATEGTRYLLRHIEKAEQLLEEGLKSKDSQQGFLCAYVLGMAGRRRSIERVAPILISHLADNDIGGDACMSAAALYRLGEQVIPYVREASCKGDQQQQEVIGLILKDLRSPPRDRAELRGRRRFQSISNAVYDPAVEYEVIHLHSGSWREGRNH